MKTPISAFAAAGLFGGMILCAAEKTTEVSVRTTTVISETVIREKVKWSPLKVFVLDFASADTQGQKRFLDSQNRPIVIPAQCTLTDADRQSMNSVMQGFVRMIDAADASATNDANRHAQKSDNSFTRAKALELYNAVVKGESRPMVFGADYLSAYLGRHGDVFSCMDSGMAAAAMKKLSADPAFPQNFMLNLARATGATHLITGTVADLHSRSVKFKGYGIETENTLYELDVIVKVIDLAAQGSVYSNVYTGTCRVQKRPGAEQFDSSMFQTLMKAAMEQAAEDIYEAAKPGPNNKIAPSAVPYALTVNPAGDVFLRPETVEVWVDGVRAAGGGETFLVPAGKHTLELKAAGYKTKTVPVDVTADAVINLRMEK